MKKSALVFLLFIAFVVGSYAQQNDSTTVEKSSTNVILKTGSLVVAVLKGKLDVETTKNSDDFVLTLSREINGAGVQIVTGTELLGRVVRVKKVDSDDDISEISLFFDFLKLEDDYLRFKAIVTSVSPKPGEPNDAPAAKKSILKVAPSEVFKGATIISIKGKNLSIEEGAVFNLELVQDLKKP